MKPRIPRGNLVNLFRLTELRGEEAAEAVGHEDDRPVPVRHARVLHQEAQAGAEVGERPGRHAGRGRRVAEVVRGAEQVRSLSVSDAFECLHEPLQCFANFSHLCCRRS